MFYNSFGVGISPSGQPELIPDDAYADFSVDLLDLRVGSKTMETPWYRASFSFEVE